MCHGRIILAPLGQQGSRNCREPGCWATCRPACASRAFRYRARNRFDARHSPSDAASTRADDHARQPTTTGPRAAQIGRSPDQARRTSQSAAGRCNGRPWPARRLARIRSPARASPRTIANRRENTDTAADTPPPRRKSGQHQCRADRLSPSIGSTPDADSRRPIPPDRRTAPRTSRKKPARYRCVTRREQRH